MQLKVYNSSFKNEWDSFVKKAKNTHFFFQRDFMEYHSDRFIDNSLMFYKNNKLKSVLPANIKSNILNSHDGLTFGGFIMDKDITTIEMLECFDVLVEYAKVNKIKEINYKKMPYIYSTHESEEDKYALFRHGFAPSKVEIGTVINLQNPAQYSRNRRRMIARSIEEGVQVKETHDFETYFEIIKEVLKEKNAIPVHTASEMQKLASKFPENIRLFSGMKNGKMICSSLVFLNQGRVCHTQYSMANIEAKSIGALDACIDYAIKFATSEGYRYFSFGISTENGGNILNEGLITQKEQFGGSGVTHDSYKLIL